MMSPCILVIDKNVNLLVSLEAQLNQAGYRVLTAHEDRQGIYLAQAALPDVILCDTAKSSSWDNVKRELAQDAQTASIPFVALTKSLDRRDLVARVNSVIRNQAAA
jgi:CRP/FNR family transcriptional regulator, polysaccharide utilization system transcription regulator